MIMKALGDPTRRAILNLLRQSDMSAGAIAEHFDLAKATLSGHFEVLKAADLVETTRQGTTIMYSLRVSVLEDAMISLLDGFDLAASVTRRLVSKEET